MEDHGVVSRVLRNVIGVVICGLYVLLPFSTLATKPHDPVSNVVLTRVCVYIRQSIHPASYPPTHLTIYPHIQIQIQI